MRESNFAFPTQNKACVCITSQLYDRRALDTSSPLPLLNSLTHLTYLTSTSPRIREIMTMDGGLERLVRILHDFCICPPPPDNGAVFYGLIPPHIRPSKPVPTLNPPQFDKQAAYRFSLAFQCVVNIGVRGSEPIRTRVVQAGTLDVVGCILEAWLANKGFAVGPSSSATGMPRETREQRQARRDAAAAAVAQRQQAELERQREQRDRQPAAQRGPRPPIVRLPGDDDVVDPTGPRPTTRRSHREGDAGPLTVRMQTRDADLVRGPRRPTLRLPGQFDEDESMDTTADESTIHEALLLLSSASTPTAATESDTELSTDASAAPTPVGSGTPTGSVVVPSRDRSGTIIARPMWDRPTHREDRQYQYVRRASPESPAGGSRGDTETETEGEDVDMDRGAEQGQGQTEPRHQHRRAVGIVSDDPPVDTHIIISESGVGVGVDGVGVGVGVGDVGVGGVEDGIVSMEANDDFAMGAPPGAPGAIAAGIGIGMGIGIGGESEDESSQREGEGDVEMAPPPGPVGIGNPDATPRPGVVGLPRDAEREVQIDMTPRIPVQPAPASSPAAAGTTTTTAATAAATAGQAPAQTPHRHRHHHHHVHPHPHPHVSHSHTHQHPHDTSPYRDEDVLLSLQLLAYLSKYPHVRQAFYKPRTTFHPASVDVVGGRWAQQQQQQQQQGKVRAGKERETGQGGFLRSLGLRKDDTASLKEPARTDQTQVQCGSASTSAGAGATQAKLRQTNVFSLVERFTFKPSTSETELLTNPPPRLPPEIQYWAGVVMRNACRKDESRGGIRQCANSESRLFPFFSSFSLRGCGWNADSVLALVAVLCGRWEAYPREFAKCRRCRKAKYCGKECQSTAWSEGHRFWCSAKDDDDAAGNANAGASTGAGASAGGTGASSETDTNANAAAAATARRERRERDRSARERERERERERSGTVRAPGPAPGPVYPDTSHQHQQHNIQRLVPPSTMRPVGRAAYFAQAQAQQDPIGTPARSGTGRVTQQQVGFVPIGHDGFAESSASVLGVGSGSGSGSGVGRRRAETVTGASLVGQTMGGGTSLVHHLHGPGFHPPGQGQGPRANPLLQFVQPRVGEAGPSRWSREEEGDDMVLG
ncbi:hypothetical protein C0992_005012 [Termitomyces sp. T32_za158]|nr:hypothetical protein C0992_005012 [Termitomyces sp. T32_za158]